jgi:hypothetical protein
VLHIKDFIRAQQRGILTHASGVDAADPHRRRHRQRRSRSSSASDATAPTRRLVVDEHGGTLGLVTMDDVIADVMDDEAHSADIAAVRHDDGSLSLDGEVTLAELEDDHGIVITNPTSRRSPGSSSPPPASSPQLERP